MAKIVRDPAAAALEKYDLIIIGGGIYGAMLSLEASRRGLRSLLLERHDFGGATSFNSLRIIHGGLRYLQKMDWQRFRESVGERKWFLQTFPNLVGPLPCLMPLYGQGLKRPGLFRLALRANDLLSYKRNHDLHPDRHLPPGQIVSVDRTREIFPSVDIKGLKGGAVWHDAFMQDSQRLLIEILRWSCGCGGTALNYLEAQQLLKSKKGVTGVAAIDKESGKSFEYKSGIVVNASGPWCRDLAAHFHRDEPALFRSSIAWNVLLNRAALSDHALAVVPREAAKAQVYFLLPWKGKLLAGTGHAPWHGSLENPTPSTEDLQMFLDDINLAVPSLEVDRDDVLFVFAGLLPVTKAGSVRLTTKEVIINHAHTGGPRGLYSISGVKFTTSRLVAEKTLNRVFPKKKIHAESNNIVFTLPDDAKNKRGIFDTEALQMSNKLKLREMVGGILQEESVQHLDDLVLRRTNLWGDPRKALKIGRVLCGLFEWSDSRRSEEIARLTEIYKNGNPMG